MSIANEILRLQTAKADIKAAIENKGVTVGDGTIDTYAEKINEISSGDGGSENPFYYIGTMEFAFTNVAFPENSEIVCKVLNNTKWYTAFSKTSGIKSLKIICDTPDLTFNFYALVRESKNLEVLDLSEIKGDINNISYFMYGTKTLKTILGELDLSKCTTSSAYANAFTSSNSLLEDIRFVPNTIKLSVSFAYQQYLSGASIQSIIDGLATVETAQTLTLHANVKILQSQVDSANAKGWTVAGGTVVSEEEYYG